VAFLGPLIETCSVLRPLRRHLTRGLRLGCEPAVALFFAGLLSTAAFSQSPFTVFPGSSDVGQASAPVSVLVTLPTGGTAASAAVITQGSAKADFSLANSGTCSASLSYTAGQQCLVSVVFQPQYPGLRTGAIVVSALDGTVIGTALLAGSATGPLAVLSPGAINTVAGDGDWIYRGDGVAATSAPIFLPTGVTEDAAGNLYLSDSNNNRIRRVDAQTGLISTVAGNGSPGYSGDGTLATNASISSPSGLLLDGAGNLYFVDTGNQCIRRIDAFSGIIKAVAGTCGVQGYSGDNGPATSATLSLPQGLAMDAAGNLYIADTGNNVVREVNALTKSITTIAGTGVAGYNQDSILAQKAMLSSPWGVAVGLDGSVYIADLDNNRIRKINAAGFISTVAGDGTRSFGGDGSAAISAQLNAPAAVVLDPAGNLYIADSGNNRVRELSSANGDISTITGGNSEQFDGDGGPANQATFYGPYSLFFDQTGTLLIADMFHNRIRSVSATTVALQYDTIRVGKTSPPQTETLINDGNALLNLTTFTLSNAALDPATTTCAAAGTIAIDASCALGVEFAPTTIGTDIQGSITVNSNAGNGPNVISVSGDVLSVNPTSVTLASSENPSLLNDVVTFTASISSSDTTLGGTVAFLDGTVVLCPAVTVTSANTAACTLSTLALGQHSITASYTGDSDNAASVSPALVQVVKQSAQLTLNASPNPAVVTSTVTLTATATAATGTPTGAITFLDGTTAIGSAMLNSSGIAIYSTAQLTAGTHSLSATYAGDASNAIAQSSAVSEVISLATSVTTLASSNASVPVGIAVTFTAGVSSTNGPAPTGTVQFTDGTTALGTSTLVNGIATLTLSTLTPGQHQIVATYAGDTDNAASNSSSLLEAIQQIATASTLTSSLNPGTAGAAVQLTATVTMAVGAIADGAITGQVVFTDAGKTLGTATLSGSGTATLTTSTLTVGPHSIQASYAGNTNYSGSASTALTETIASTTTTTSLTTSGNTLAGKTVTLTATVSSSTGTPTGTVTFQDNGASIGQATLNTQAVATLSITTLAAGNHTLIAVYAGDSSYNTSTSAPATEVITLGTSTLTLAGPTSPLDAGLPATFTATLATNGVAPTGSLTLRDGNTTIATQTVAATGTFTFTIASLAIGSHTLTVAYAGDTNNSPSVSTSVVLVIQQATTSTALQTSQNPQTLGQSLTLTAAVSSAGPSLSGSISFFDGTTLIGSAALGANGTATLATSSLTFGVHTLTAVYAGDTNHSASTSPALSERIVETVQTGLTSSADPAISGTAVVFTLKVAGSGSVIPTGAVTFLDGATLLSSGTLDATGSASFSTNALAVGTHSITASYAGDSNYAAAATILVQTITSASTQVVLTASTNPATFGSALTLKAVVTSNGGLATGPVTFADSGKPIGTAVLDATGTATLTLSTLAPGGHTIVANYAGDGKAAASVSTPLALSVRQSSTVALASSANPSMTLSAITFTASVTNAGQNVPTGSITFTDGATQLGVVTLNATGSATLSIPSLSAGSHTITASYSGDTTNFSATSSPLTQTIQLRVTTVALTATSNPTNDQQVTLISVVRWTGPTTPTGTVSFLSGTAVVGSSTLDVTGVATLTILIGTNPETLTASYNGDTAYAGSVSPPTTISAEPATQFTLQMSPSSLSVQSKQHATVSLTVSSVTNFSDTMQFGCLGLPYAATCTFSNSQATLKAGGTATVQLTVDTGDPLGAGAQAGNVQATPSRTMLCFLPGILALGIGLLRNRWRPTMALCALLLSAAALLSSTGCSSLQVNGTPAGTYTFQVTAQGQNTGVSQSQTMTLTVTE